MRVICDTSIWIEYFRAKEPLFTLVRTQLERQESIGLECVFGELLQGVLSKQERAIVLDCWSALPKFAMDGLWLEAGEYSAIHRLPERGIGLIDAAIAVATLRTDALLWTLDKKLASILPGKHLYKSGV
jgi:predicted nucleic acid-binding protein